MLPSAVANDANTIRGVARGLWRHLIFPMLGIEVGDGKHRACPFCGGRDRFRCDDQDGSGSWYCNQCEPHAGDGFELVKKVLGCDFPEALRRVAGVLGITPSLRRSAPQPVLKPQRSDRRKTAHALGMHAQDLEDRAQTTRNAASGLDCSSWSSDDWDRAVDAVGRVYDDLSHAENLFATVDRLHERAYAEEQAEKNTKENR